MYYLHLRAFVFLCLFVFMLGINSINAQTNENEQSSEVPEEILIFRTSPGKEELAEGWFRFQVSTFSPIMVIKVNGFAQMVTEDADWAEIEVPYYLKTGRIFLRFLYRQKQDRVNRNLLSLMNLKRRKGKNRLR